MTETMIHLMLGAPYGRLTVVQRLNFVTGAARFDIRGKRAAGAFVFKPHTDTDHAVPVDLYIQYGDGDRWSRQGRFDHPEFNGVPLDGGTLLRPEHQTVQGLQYRLNLRRPDTTWYHHTRYPDRAAEHATAVVAALLTHWLAMPQRPDLLRSAAMHDAQERIRRITHRTITPGWEQIAQTTAEIDRAFHVVEQLRELLYTAPS